MGGAKPTTHQYPIRFETTHNDITYHISSIAMEGSGGGGGGLHNTIQFNSVYLRSKGLQGTTGKLYIEE